ncbi:hypothetical protein [Paracoccus ravus]|uniref:hypothetical protein n=1 Tax=Paracoccus ravus TaxID=2447760 RepID=UPI00106EB8B2|nr:hypothetical protein [Paracoccus ravus]
MSRPVFGFCKGRIALSAAYPSILGRVVNKAALDLLDRVGNLDPDAALARLRDLQADLRTLEDLVRCADKAAKDLDAAARALAGEDILDGGKATTCAMEARATLEFLNRLAPDADRSSVAATIERLRKAAHAMSESADSAYKRASEIRKHLGYATESALAHPGSNPTAILQRFDCSPVTKSQIDSALAAGASDARLREICAEAAQSRVKAARAEKRSRAARVVHEIERAAEAAWQ